MIGVNDPGAGVQRMVEFGTFQHTLLDLAGVAHGLVAIAPFVIGIVVAIAFGVGSLGRAELARGARWAPIVVVVWALAATLLPRPLRLEPSRWSRWRD